MKALKTILLVLVIAALSVSDASAWSKRDQGILIGAGAALLLPPLLQAGRNSYYNEPVRYVQQPVQYQQYAPVQYVEQPRTTYIIQDQYNSGFAHRQPRAHNYLYNRNSGDRVIIEHADGTRTIIDR